MVRQRVHEHTKNDDSFIVWKSCSRLSAWNRAVDINWARELNMPSRLDLCCPAPTFLGQPTSFSADSNTEYEACGRTSWTFEHSLMDQGSPLLSLPQQALGSQAQLKLVTSRVQILVAGPEINAMSELCCNLRRFIQHGFLKAALDCYDSISSLSSTSWVSWMCREHKSCQMYNAFPPRSSL